ncbi:MAG: replication initiation protein [Clostridium sp.]|nr:replication initiation protein [Clostridium sp.]
MNDFDNDLQLQESKKVYQSWQLTKIKYKFNKTEKNIFLKVVELAQKYLNKENLGKKCSFEIQQKFGEKYPQISFPIKDLLKSNSKNYEFICQSLESLGGKAFGLPKNSDWDFSKIFIFQKVSASETKGIAQVELTPSFWEAFQNVQTYKIIDTHLAYKFDSVYTMRIYELLVGNKVTITYKIENLKEMFCLEQYTPSLFISNVIKTAQNEMKELVECPFYFEYEIIKEGRRFDRLKFDVIYKQPIMSLDSADNVSTNTFNAQSSSEFPARASIKIQVLVQSLFKITVISVELDSKLFYLESSIGESELTLKLVDISTKMTTSSTEIANPEAYLIECLDNMIQVAQSRKSKQKQKAEDVPVIESSDVTPEFVTSKLSSREKCLEAILIIKSDVKYMQEIAVYHNVDVKMIEKVLDRIVKNDDLNNSWGNDDSVEKLKKHLMNAKSIIEVLNNDNAGVFCAPMSVAPGSNIKRRKIENANLEDYYEW